MAVEIEVIEPKLFDGAVADELVASLHDCIAESGRCSLVLAGGGTPAGIYRLLARPPRVSEIDWPKVDLFWGDERWVAKTDDQSNFRMVSETLLSQLPPPGPKVHGVPTELSNAAEGAAAYERAIRESLALKDAAPPVFDIVLLGIGEDGHTASLFPGSPALNKSNGVCVAVESPYDHKPRVTLSPGALFSARKVFFIVKGTEKAEVIQKVLEGNEPTERIPSRLYQQAKGDVTFLLDTGAAQRLSRNR